jgi:hypothetical protein
MMKHIQRIKRLIPRLLPHLFLLGLIIWGGYVTFAFLGVDSHIVILLQEEHWRSIARDVNGSTDGIKYFLRGLYALVPFFEKLLTQLKPFTGYAVISLLAYLAYVAYTVLNKGRLFIDARVSALHVLIFGIVSVWLLTTTLFYSESIPGMQPEMMVEPIPEVYENVSDQTIEALQANFTRLVDSGCLKQDEGRRGKGGAGVYHYSGWCVHKAFVTRSLSQIGMLLILIINFLVIGKFILWLLKIRPSSQLIELIVSLGAGSAGMIFILWFFAFVHIIGPISAWVLLMLVPAIGYKYSWYWIRSSYSNKWQVRCSFYSASIILFWLLMSYIAFNFLTVVRPFPIGWDDLGRYINGPRQMSAFGGIFPGMFEMKWEYITSLGFVLFGYFSWFGATLAQQINWLAGILALFSVFVCTRMILGERSGLLAALFYYTLPMVGHFSFADMKTENALLFFGAVGLICVIYFLKPDTSSTSNTSSTSDTSAKWLLIAGFITAAGFATKPTIVLLFFVSGIVLSAGMLGTLAGFVTTFLSLSAVTFMGVVPMRTVFSNWTGIAAPEMLKEWTSILFLLLAVACLIPIILKFRKPKFLIKQYRERKEVKHFLLASGMLALGFMIYSAPWMMNNMRINERVAISAALGAPNKVTPLVSYAPDLSQEAPSGSRSLPEELAIDPDHEMCQGTSREEELDRYWGHGNGPSHYLGLPWRVVMNRDSQGYYLTTSALILMLPLLLLLPAFWKNRMLRLVFWGTMLYAAEWVFAANGIPWYGIGMFLGFAICIEALIMQSPDKSTRVVGGVLFGVALAIVFSLRLWQFDMQQNLYEYSWGKASAEVLQEMTIPDYNDIADHVIELSKNPDRPYLYRMGTFINYFIPRNLEIIVQHDNQLGFFNCLNQGEDHVLTLKRLLALGIHSIVFDTNTDTIEKDPNGTLHKKVDRFLEFANDPAVGIESVVDNPSGGIAYMILPEEVPSGEAEEEAGEESSL